MNIAHLTEHLEAALFYRDERTACLIIRRFLTAPGHLPSIRDCRALQRAYWDHPAQGLALITLAQGSDHNSPPNP